MARAFVAMHYLLPSMFKLFVWAALAALLALSASAGPVNFMFSKRDSVCNGYSELCERKYSNVTYIGAHDSYAVGKTTSLGANQQLDVNDQLDSGIRTLQIQGHKSGNSASGISLCHTSCTLMNAGAAEKYFSQVSKWVQTNPDEVITIIIANNDNLPATQWRKAFSSSGLDKYAFSPGSEKLSKNDWPTLQEMINKNRRVVVFMDYETNTDKVEYILPEFKNVWENEYDQSKTPFNCTPSRISGESSQMMYLENHYLNKEGDIFGKKYTKPDVDQLDKTNSANSLLKDANKCAQRHESYPTFMLVDFFDSNNGSVFEAAATMNNVKYSGTKISTSSTHQDQGENSTQLLRPTITPYLLGIFIIVLLSLM